MNIFAQFQDYIRKEIQSIEFDTQNEIELSRVSVEPPRDASHGDMATNAAMILAKQVGMAPRDVAQLLVDAISKHKDIQSAEIAGPGFINLRLHNSFWQDQLQTILREGKSYGSGAVGDGAKVNVEYVSANPTGPLHVGHCRGTVVGDALANLLEFAGYAVTKEYYVNDAGSQIDVLANSVYLRYREALGETVGEIPPGLYPGDYLVPLGKALSSQYGDTLLEMDPDERMRILKDASVEAMMKLIRDDLASLNVRHDVFYSERSLHEISGNKSKISEALDTLRQKGFVFEGRLPPPKGRM